MICAMCEQAQHSLCLNRDNVRIEGAGDAAEARSIAEMLGAGQCTCSCQAIGAAGGLVKVERDRSHLQVVEHDQVHEIQPIDDYALAAAFAEAEKLPRLVRPTSVRERDAVGAAIARLMLSCETPEDADTAALRIVARLGPEEALAAGDVLSKWALALGAAAGRARAKGHL